MLDEQHRQIFSDVLHGRKYDDRMRSGTMSVGASSSVRVNNWKITGTEECFPSNFPNVYRNGSS